MTGSFVTLILAALLAQAPGRSGSLDPAFEKYPVERWASERDQQFGRWSATVDTPKLSFHQRLVATVSVKVDGRELQGRRKGELIYFVQITDAAGARFQNHESVDLAKLQEDSRSYDFQLLVSAFVLPGEYQLTAAILNTDTGEHSARRSTFRVAPPKVDFLRAAWERLPTVEFLGKDEPPDGWFNPTATGRLQWAADVRNPARLDVVLNIVAPPPQATARQGESVELAALVPTARALSEHGAPAIAERLEVLDISRHKSVFDEQQKGALDWDRLKGALSRATTASIDLHSLSERHQDAQFFVHAIRKIVAGSEQEPCALVVLSPPAEFESGENLAPISTEALPACRVFYVRYRAAPQMHPLGAGPFGGPMPRGPFGRRGAPMPPMRSGHVVVDQLAQTLKPLNPKIIDVETPDQLTHVFMDIEKALQPGRR